MRTALYIRQSKASAHHPRPLPTPAVMDLPQAALKSEVCSCLQYLCTTCAQEWVHWLCMLFGFCDLRHTHSREQVDCFEAENSCCWHLRGMQAGVNEGTQTGGVELSRPHVKLRTQAWPSINYPQLLAKLTRIANIILEVLPVHEWVYFQICVFNVTYFFPF